MIDTLVLNVGTVETILSVDELDDISEGVSHSAIIFDHDFLKSLDQLTLDVTGFGSLDSSIDQTFTTSHGVEEELGRSQATEV